VTSETRVNAAQVEWVLKDQWAHKASKDLLVHQELVFLAELVREVTLENKEHREVEDQQVHQDPPVLPVTFHNSTDQLETTKVPVNKSVTTTTGIHIEDFLFTNDPKIIYNRK